MKCSISNLCPVDVMVGYMHSYFGTADSINARAKACAIPFDSAELYGQARVMSYLEGYASGHAKTLHGSEE